MVEEKQRQKIMEAIRADRENYESDKRHATVLGITPSVYNTLKKGDTDRKLSDGNWIRIARKLGVALRSEMEWKPARTATFMYVTAALGLAQEGSLSSILCGIPNIGKTYTARYYAKTHKHVAYVDCSQVKTKTQMVKAIAREFGVSTDGMYASVYEDLTYYLRSIERPLVILDEAGDLKHEAMLELKALWNATERHCAWYMMGADGLQERIRRSIEMKMVGYTELLSRFGGRYCKATPDGAKEREQYLMKQARLVADVNVPEGMDAQKVALASGGSLRRVYTEIEKGVRTAAMQEGGAR